MRRVLPLSLLLTIAVLSCASSASAQTVFFRTAANNVACAASGPEIRCDLRESTAPLPVKPASCEFDYGLFFRISTTARKGVRICAGDTVLGSSEGTLFPGRTQRYRSMRCTAQGRTGMRCVNRRGHGFSISPARQRLF
jgi:hypothetical protein